ncbi:nuclear transport factor 2 family protein [Mangrovimonas aestuarii]|uniref:nuclear transport factor 2 family protein n=1 Tax=Mangrovimonas aestuarii TaxID=3018443 RepID=UPI0023794C0D|nr:nuclear transport factor 2 family protein [Mangrovimonas aestuarii]
MTAREEIIETINKLFIYTDAQNWDGLQTYVFAETVHLDMSSMGGKAMDTTAKVICDMWHEGFNDLDAVNHLAGNYLVKLVNPTEAKAFAYATATHYKALAKNGNTRAFIGTYTFKLHKSHQGWRIYHFVYKLKYSTGNLDLT